MFFIFEQQDLREYPVAVNKTSLYLGILLSCCLHAIACLLIVNVSLQAPFPAGAAGGPVLSLQLSQAPTPAVKSAGSDSVVTTPSAQIAKNHRTEERQPTQKPQPAIVRTSPNEMNTPGRSDSVRSDPVNKDPNAGENRVASVPPPVEDIRLQPATSIAELSATLQDPQPAADTQTIATAVTTAMSQMPLSITEASRLVTGAEQTPWPSYPAVARRRGWEGTALIGILVSEEGELMDIRLLASSGKAVLDEAAVSALSAWRLPSAADAEPQWFEVPVEFALR